ncbi:hypothetical protein O181_068468 [Austropuccinia psidii MF-1]|uniref:Uncharacterized protein n=1 Tax=Austropuccinia psidii MF-1 TaxID=1389203 RepID=A0A9Q3EVB5_9BASI|nr:hypothetical protein [Austropuccinia psidii MF-1]
MKFYSKTHPPSTISKNSNHHQSSSYLNDPLSLTHHGMVMPKPMSVHHGLVQIDSIPRASSNKPSYTSAKRERRKLIDNSRQALQKSGTKHKKMRHVSVLSIRAKKDNQTCFKLPPMTHHNNPYRLINATIPSDLPVIIYKVHCFNHPT